MKLTALAGGGGASKLLYGLSKSMPASDLSIIVNTGDDIQMHDLYISPDIDTVTYTLAGWANPVTGWGLVGDTFETLEKMRQEGRETWFQLGDYDLNTHRWRTAFLKMQLTLTQASLLIRTAYGVEAQILPMCDEPVPTMIETDRGLLHFQEYLVREQAEPVVRGIRFAGIEAARPTEKVLQAIAEADAIVVCPSNPLISIGPILAVPGMRDALRGRRERVLAVSPIVGGKSLKGPSDRMMAQLGYEVSATAVARLYADFVSTFVIDTEDAAQASEIEQLGMRVRVGQTVMRNDADKISLARQVLQWAGELAGAA